MRVNIQVLKKQVSQLPSLLSKLESQGKLPSQTVVNPKQNAYVITLRGSKELKEPNKMTRKNSLQEEVEKEKLNGEKPNPIVVHPPFPERFAKSKKQEKEKKIIETFCKVEESILLLDAIKQKPQYAKFLNELCTNKRKLKGNERISIGENVSSMLQRRLPPKYKDLGNIKIKRAMCELGASINGVRKDVLISLRRPFLRTFRTKIDLYDSTFTIEFDGDIIKFDIYDTTKYPSNVSYVFAIDVANTFTQQTLDSSDDAYENSRTWLVIVTNVFSHGAIEIKILDIKKNFKISVHNLKHFFEGPQA
ncbi:hypothetical protein CDL12_12826 [Handroanthus impetiginosus]|uniref:Uncharacterized protein n=1 Tax=Handroanthus impetiginosus TaxID=429701 RepID=A0A2G9HAP6_9LAMI|nr:hypothetical protein CDL12_12826 [Handroanthus impetiginosus]